MPQLIWLVTGCSSGLGAVFVRAILVRGDKVIASARNVSALEILKEAGAAVVQLDVTAPQADIDARIKEATACYGSIDVLVNNAAHAEFGTLEDLGSLARTVQHQRLRDINFTRSILPQFRQRRAGIIVFIGWMAGWVSDPAAGPYCASKFALEGVVEAFQGEIKDLGIKSLIVEPGYFRTQLLSAENSRPIPTKHNEYKLIVDTLFEALKNISSKQPGDPKKGVERVIDVVRREGTAAGREIPPRFALGSDSVAALRKKCNDTLQLLKDWEDVSSSTDFPERT